MKVLDLFAGTGVGAGLKQLGIEDLGVEINPTVRASRTLNGLKTVGHDVWDWASLSNLKVDGLWASPPCQTFSVAGAGEGNRNLTQVLDAIRDGTWRNLEGVRELPGSDETKLVLTPLWYVNSLSPKFVVLKQVPTVYPVWELFKPVLEELGYDVSVAMLNTVDFGLAQDRRRAYLVASKGSLEPYLEMPARPRKTMDDVLGWGFTNRPHPTVTGKVTVTRSATGTQQLFEREIDGGWFKMRPGHNPAMSKFAKNGIGSKYPADAINITNEEAAKLQGYPEGFKFAGTKSRVQQQIGNAVPPVVARDIVQAIVKGLNK